jgi:signal transduction histidine kinase
MIYLELKQYEKADESIRKSYYMMPRDASRADRGFLLFSLLQAVHARGTPEEFEFYFDEFIRFKAKGTSPAQLDARHMGLEVFFKNDAEAIAVFEKRMNLALADTLSYTMDLTMLALSQKYIHAGKYPEALHMLDGMSEFVEPSITAQKDRYQQYFDIYKKTNQPEKAYAALQRYIGLQDSSYQQILDTRIAEYEVKFNTQEQERNLIQKDLALTRSKLWQRSYIGLSGLLGISLLTGIIFYRRKLNHQHEMTAKEAELQAQRIRELEHKNKLLSLNAIIEGQEAERLRIAQDLHDGLGGLLTTVKAHFNSIQREIEQIKNLNVYAKTNQLIDEACVEVRRIAHDMIPYSIKISGLAGALEDLRQSIITRGPDAELEMHGLEGLDLDESKTNMVYRIIQEITNNAVKHAQAKRIFIQLMKHESTLHIMVEDNGRGFDINNVVANKGMGLKSIDSRVSYLGGKVNYDSTPGHGTTVNIEIPVQ